MSNTEIKMVLDAVAARLGAHWEFGSLFVGYEMVARTLSGNIVLPAVYEGLDMTKPAMTLKPTLGSEQIAKLICQRWPHIGCAALAA